MFPCSPRASGPAIIRPNFWWLTRTLAQLNCIRALAGGTYATSAETAFDTDTFNERDYLEAIRQRSGNLPVIMNWSVSFMAHRGTRFSPLK